MNLTAFVRSLQAENSNDFSFRPPVDLSEIEKMEKKTRVLLPADFREFYSLCNGFDHREDNFSILAIKNMFRDDEYGFGSVIFADYQFYTDVWAFKNLGNDKYGIIYNENEEMTLTNSLTEFLERVVRGQVSKEGGLFHWNEEVKKR